MAREDRTASLRRTFEDKVAIVTGGASGIGRAIGGELARCGATVVLADIDETGAKEVADGLVASTGNDRVRAVALDVRDADAVAEVVQDTAQAEGRLNLLFNNAGIGVGGEVADLTLAHWDRAIDVNLRGVVHGVVAAYALMVGQGYGHIVNTASLAGLVPGPMLVPYAMTKHAVVGLSVSMRAEAAVHGVRVSALCPGVIDTPILDKGNPDDLPAVPSLPAGRGRDELTRLAKAYPPESLAQDVLAGVARNDPIIVAPAHARRLWLAYRLAPRPMIGGITVGARRAVQRAGRQP